MFYLFACYLPFPKLHLFTPDGLIICPFFIINHKPSSFLSDRFHHIHFILTSIKSATLPPAHQRAILIFIPSSTSSSSRLLYHSGQRQLNNPPHDDAYSQRSKKANRPWIVPDPDISPCRNVSRFRYRVEITSDHPYNVPVSSWRRLNNSGF